MRRRAKFFLFLTLISLGSGLSACHLDNPGDTPPEGELYLPAGVLMSASTADEPARFLYVVNSNFDLRYNAGSLQAFDLDAIDEAVNGCAEDGTLGSMTCEIDSAKVLANEVLVPSLATYVTSASDHSRMYISTRTQASLTVVDTDESGDRPLSCGDTDRHCDDAHSSWTDPLADDRDLSVPPEPVGIVAGRARDFATSGDAAPDGEFVFVAHRGGEVSAFLDRGRGTKLELQDILTIGGAHPVQEPTGITFDPVTHLAYVSVFARTSDLSGGKKILGRVGLSPAEDPDEPTALYDAGLLTLEGISLGLDTRAIAPNPWVAGEMLIVSRAPNSVLWTDIAGPVTGESPPTQAFVRQAASIGRGPSRILAGTLGDRKLAIVSCFDSRQIFILDAETAETLSVVHNFSGPFELALDSARKRLYVADFRSSVIRILDLAPILEGASETVPTGRIVATLGHPQSVQELQ